MTRRGCSCCVGCRTYSFPEASNWRSVNGGSIIDDAEGVLIDGEARPNRWMEKEAFFLSFRVSGKVTIKHEGQEYIIDGPNGEITAGGQTRTFAEPLNSPDYFATVYFRLTPTHSWLYAAGTNNPAHFSQHAMLVQDRSTAPSEEFVIDADNAIIADFEIADSEVIPGEDGGYYYGDAFTKRCFNPPSLVCNYTVTKTLFGTLATSGLECHPINLTYSGFTPEPGTNATTSQANFVSRPRLTLDKYSVRDSDGALTVPGTWFDSIPTGSKYNDCIEVTSGCANILVNLMNWHQYNAGTIAEPRDGFVLDYYRYTTYLIVNAGIERNVFVSASIYTAFPAETFDEPYPKPVMRAGVSVPLDQSIGVDGDGPSGGPHWIRFDGSAEASIEFSPNNIVNGFTVSASGNGTIETRSWPPPFDPLLGSPDIAYAVEDPPGSGSYRWITTSEYSHGNASASWTFSP